MTELQIKAAQLKEDIRHNKENERISENLNKAQAKHLKTSDVYTSAHYERSDQASLISANASAVNAQTNQGKYLMEKDIEYGWTGNYGYPSGMPLSAQKKSMELEMLSLDPNSQIPAVQLERKQKEAEIAKTQGETLNKITGAYTSVLNSVFGKKGVVATVDDLTNE